MQIIIDYDSGNSKLIIKIIYNEKDFYNNSYVFYDIKYQCTNKF